MSNVVPADITINDALVKQVIFEQFGLEAHHCRVLGEGWDNLVYLVNHDIVFRFPRRIEAVMLLEREIGILQKLASHVTLQIPKPLYIGEPSSIFPRPFYGHKLIKGRSGCSVHLSENEYKACAKTLAHFLQALHALDVDRLKLNALELKPTFDRVDWPRMKSFFLDRFDQVEKNYPMAAHRHKISSILSHAEQYKQNTQHPVVVQGDLYHRHLLFDDKNCLVGIIDWGDSGVGDPVADLGVVYQFFPPDIRNEFFDNYQPVDQQAKDYARFLGLYYAIALLWFGHDRNDVNLIRTSLWTLDNI